MPYAYGGAKMELAKRIFFTLTMAMALMCFVCLFLVERGTAEYVVALLAGIINCCAVLVQLITLLLKGKK